MPMVLCRDAVLNKKHFCSLSCRRFISSWRLHDCRRRYLCSNSSWVHVNILAPRSLPDRRHGLSIVDCEIACSPRGIRVQVLLSLSLFFVAISSASRLNPRPAGSIFIRLLGIHVHRFLGLFLRLAVVVMVVTPPLPSRCCSG